MKKIINLSVVCIVGLILLSLAIYSYNDSRTIDGDIELYGKQGIICGTLYIEDMNSRI